MLLNPFEKPLHLPALLVNIHDKSVARRSWQIQIPVGETVRAGIAFITHHAAQLLKDGVLVVHAPSSTTPARASNSQDTIESRQGIHPLSVCLTTTCNTPVEFTRTAVTDNSLVEYRPKGRFNNINMVKGEQTNKYTLSDRCTHCFTALIKTWPPNRFGQWRHPH